MRSYPDCYICLLQQALGVIREAGTAEAWQYQI